MYQACLPQQVCPISAGMYAIFYHEIVSFLSDILENSFIFAFCCDFFKDWATLCFSLNKYSSHTHHVLMYLQWQGSYSALRLNSAFLVIDIDIHV